jgi:diadenosine tetraphosphate (Ap4A) HIT family hydrolase
MLKPACQLCEKPGGELFWQDEFCRVIRVDDPDYPGFCRVVLNRHVAEMSDLAQHEQSRLMEVVFAVESAIREVLTPDKVNLASLGNVVPHLHWHIIPRYTSDRHFPNPIWGSSLREGLPANIDHVAMQALKLKIQQILD